MIETVIELLMIIDHEIKEHRIQPTMSECLKGKRVAETLINLYREKYNLEIRIARIFNTYGPRLNINDGRVISNFIKQCLIGDNLTIYGDGKQTRSFCYVDDLINGLIKLMDSNFEMPINIGNPNELSILELSEIIKTFANLFFR